MTTTSPTTSGHDIERLRTAIEARDASRVVAWYAEDATLTILDRDHPPSAPAVYRGLHAIRDYYQDICGRNIHHEVRDAVATAEGLAFTQHCSYPDGTAVLCATVARTRNGKIHRQTAVQVWDS
ncbi:MAG TPA: nuclear transport factor 2 family protein [Streptosporangiaceae bacterium]|nr:nuclear transport factor 2 family protein [Streptosporangiaceae bacterium]